MTSTDCDLDGAADGVLPFNFREVDAAALRGCLEKAALVGREWLDDLFVIQETHGLIEAGDGVDGDAFDQGGLVGRFGGHDESPLTELFCQHGHGEGAFDRAGFTGKTEFAGDEEIVQLGVLALPHRGEDGQGDG